MGGTVNMGGIYIWENCKYGRYLYMGGTVNMGGKVLYTVIHQYNSCTQYSTPLSQNRDEKTMLERNVM